MAQDRSLAAKFAKARRAANDTGDSGPPVAYPPNTIPGSAGASQARPSDMAARVANLIASNRPVVPQRYPQAKPAVAVPMRADPQPMDPGADLLSQYMAMLQNPVQRAGVALPDHGSYIAPYDQAQQAAQTGAATANQTIGSQYGDLKSELQKQAQGYAIAQGEIDKQHEAATAQLRQQASQLMHGTAGTISQGGPASGAEGLDAVTQAQQASMVAQQANNADMSKSVRDMTVNGLNQDATATQGASAAAQQNNQAQLAGLLNQIGLGRAGAERQYQSDLQSAQSQNSAISAQNQGTKMSALETMLKMTQADPTGNDPTGGKAAPVSKQTGRSWIESNITDINKQYPKTMKVFADLLSPQTTKDGTTIAAPKTSAQALQALNDYAPMLKQVYGWTLGKQSLDRLRWLVTQYYQTSPSSSPAASGTMFPYWHGGVPGAGGGQ